jgi:hypothetical protein
MGLDRKTNCKVAGKRLIRSLLPIGLTGSQGTRGTNIDVMGHGLILESLVLKE